MKDLDPYYKYTPRERRERGLLPVVEEWHLPVDPKGDRHAILVEGEQPASPPVPEQNCRQLAYHACQEGEAMWNEAYEIRVGWRLDL